MIIMCALLAEAFFKVSIPIVDGLDVNVAKLLKTGDRIRINGTTGVIEVIARG
jgi:predicted aconitase with swiveling domain